MSSANKRVNRGLGRFPAEQLGALVPGGVYLIPDGHYYVGELRNGKPHGRGRLYRFFNDDPPLDCLAELAYYEGDFQDGKYHGDGILQWANGNYHKGEFRNGVIEGHCEIVYDNGIFVGNVHENMPSGFGRLERKTGECYEGVFENNLYHGQGILNLPDGRRYEGEFRNGVFNGLGTLTYPDGKVLKGRFAGGRFVFAKDGGR